MSSILDQYTIQFSGLAIGRHEFDFQVDERFFAAFEQGMIEKGQLQVHLVLDKSSQMLSLEFQLQGTVDVDCDRCAQTWPFPVNTTNKLIIRMSDSEEVDDDPDILYMSRSEYQFNASQHLYEYIATAIPFHTIPCEITGNTGLCDLDVLNRLQAMQTEHKEENSNPDPRWEALKELKNN